MRAVRIHQFGGPEVLALEDVPDPKPAAGEVIVRVRAAGVNPVDTYIPTGNYAFKPPLPMTVSPRACASWTAATPTPPVAPWINAVSPARTCAR